MMQKVFGLGLILLFNACQTTKPTYDPKDAPEINSKIETDKAVEAAINYGGDTLKKTRQLVTSRNEWPATEKLLQQAIMDNVNSYESAQLFNVVTLYQVSPAPVSEVVFVKLISSGRALAKQLGWQLAAAKPSRQVAYIIEKELTRAVTENDEQSVYMPQVAAAIQANRLRSAYTVMRQALFATNHEAFAYAMSTLNPNAASEDFIAYLSQSPAEELRQMTLKTLDAFTCLHALNHLKKVPASVTNPGIETLFYYSVSRNNALSDAANAVLENYFMEQQSLFAQLMARQPVWVQVAYIENARRNTTAQKKKFLSELQRVSSQNEVLDELKEIRL